MLHKPYQLVILHKIYSRAYTVQNSTNRLIKRAKSYHRVLPTGFYPAKPCRHVITFQTIPTGDTAQDIQPGLYRAKFYQQAYKTRKTIPLGSYQQVFTLPNHATMLLHSKPYHHTLKNYVRTSRYIYLCVCVFV